MSETTKHTKVWRVNGSDQSTAIWVEDANGKRVCTVRNCDTDLDRARLIAAAPIGYDLAFEVMRLCNVGVTVPESVAKLAADFISKATGK